MTALVRNTTKNSDKSMDSSPSSISVTARIDYILRFSKKAIAVIDDNGQTYPQVARQYLATLTKPVSHSQQSCHSINVAFVSASTKLNDIQMRCRLVEQLFANTLFDPEQSVAISILRLAKQQSESITIVVEHAQALSLQLTYELSQLVSLSKKSNTAINVVLFGQNRAGQQIAANNKLFKDKLALVDANSGQLFSASHQRFESKVDLHSRSINQRVAIISVMIVVLILVCFLAISQYENFVITDLPQREEKNRELAMPLAFAQNDNVFSNNIISEKPDRENMTVAVNMASTADIHQALTAKLSVSPAEKVQAVAMDVLYALQKDRTIAKKRTGPDLTQIEVTKRLVPREKGLSSAIPSVREISIDNANDYYFQIGKGFVIQIAAFRNKALWQQFTEKHHELELYSYQRITTNTSMTIVTSKAYASKQAAKAAINSLSKEIAQRGPWIKEISAVITEINTFAH